MYRNGTGFQACARRIQVALYLRLTHLHQAAGLERQVRCMRCVTDASIDSGDQCGIACGGQMVNRQIFTSARSELAIDREAGRLHVASGSQGGVAVYRNGTGCQACARRVQVALYLRLAHLHQAAGIERQVRCMRCGAGGSGTDNGVAAGSQGRHPDCHQAVYRQALAGAKGIDVVATGADIMQRCIGFYLCNDRLCLQQAAAGEAASACRQLGHAAYRHRVERLRTGVEGGVAASLQQAAGGAGHGPAHSRRNILAGLDRGVARVARRIKRQVVARLYVAQQHADCRQLDIAIHPRRAQVQGRAVRSEIAPHIGSADTRCAGRVQQHRAAGSQARQRQFAAGGNGVDCRAGAGDAVEDGIGLDVGDHGACLEQAAARQRAAVGRQARHGAGRHPVVSLRAGCDGEIAARLQQAALGADESPADLRGGVIARCQVRVLRVAACLQRQVASGLHSSQRHVGAGHCQDVMRAGQVRHLHLARGVEAGTALHAGITHCQRLA